MKIIWALFIKEWKNFWSDKVAVMLTFLVPFFIIFLIGTIFGISPKKKSGGGGGGGPSGIRVAMVDLSGSEMSEAMIQAVDADRAFRAVRTREQDDGVEVPLTEADVREDIVNNRYRYALVFPEDAFSNGFGFKVKLLQNPRNQIETQTTEGLLQKNLMMAYFQNLQSLSFAQAPPELIEPFIDSLAEVVTEHMDVSEEDFRSVFPENSIIPDFRKIMRANTPAPDTDANEAEQAEAGTGNLFNDLMDIQKERIVGKGIKNPQGVLVVAGYSVMFLLFTLNGISGALFDEKKAGLFLRLLSSPVTRSHILWSKYMFGIVMGMMQVLTMFFASWVIFRVEIMHNLPNLILAVFFVAIACTSLGMLICAFSTTQAQANGMGTVIIISMSAIGGAWFPVSFMGETIQIFSKLTVVYWSVEALLRTAFEGKAIFEMLNVVGVLLLMAALFIGISLWRFRRGNLF